jgi:Fe-S-cluster-containing dehydrogenase component
MMEGQEDNYANEEAFKENIDHSRMERCIGCHACSPACARLVNKKLSWDTAGIRIASSGGLSTGYEAKPCLACNPAPWPVQRVHALYYPIFLTKYHAEVR